MLYESSWLICGCYQIYRSRRDRMDVVGFGLICPVDQWQVLPRRLLLTPIFYILC